MNFNFIEGTKKHRVAIGKNKVDWDLELVTHLLVLASVTKTKHQFTKENGHNNENLDVRLTIDGVEVNLEAGLDKMLNIIELGENRVAKLQGLIDKFNNDVSEICD